MPRKIEEARTYLFPRDMWKQVKIKKTDLPKIQELLLTHSVAVVAEKYGVSKTTIYNAKNGYKYKYREKNRTLEQNRTINNRSSARRRFLLSMGLLPKKAKIIVKEKQ